LGRDPEKQSIVLTSPGIIYKDLLIVGDRTPEALPAPTGDIRAYDVRTGKLRWSFHTIPHPGEFGYDTWPKDAWTYTGAANNWAGMSVDAKRGIVYVPTGSAASDFYGADRVGDDLFANCLLALKADTGERIWHFQGVRHDLWDRDFPTPPVLVTVKRDGKNVDAVAQATKQGWLYLFDRVTGKPLFPIEYRHYPASDVPGEVAADTQPLPVRPAPFCAAVAHRRPAHQRARPRRTQWALERSSAKLRSEGQFVPFSVGKETVIFPGFDGGAEWGGSAIRSGNRHPVRECQRLAVRRPRRPAGYQRGHPAGRGAHARLFPTSAPRRLRATAQYVLSGESKELESGQAALRDAARITASPGITGFYDP
jgi:quinoprotein glucose dehydrogenase